MFLGVFYPETRLGIASGYLSVTRNTVTKEKSNSAKPLPFSSNSPSETVYISEDFHCFCNKRIAIVVPIRKVFPADLAI